MPERSPPESLPPETAGETDADLAARLAVDAAALALRHFEGPQDWWDKSAGNPVSRGDLEVDAFLKTSLAKARPQDGWLSEETADTPERLKKSRVWVVDPIDGTRDFVRGRTGWAVSIALVQDGQPQIAALAAPARNQLFLATRGQGATLNGTPLTIAAVPKTLRLPIDAQNLDAPFWPAPWPEGTLVEKPNSLALRMAKLAADEADAWLEGRTINEWDVAASALIVSEAGGTVTDRNGAPLTFNKPDPVVHGVAAAAPAHHALTLTYLQHALAVFAAHRRAAG